MSEALRLKLMEDAQTLYPVLPKNGPPPRARSPAAISISSNSSPEQAHASGSSNPGKPPRRGMVIESSDEDDSEEDAVEDTLASSRASSASVEEVPPPFPLPQPYKPQSIQYPPDFPRPEPFKPHNAQQTQTRFPQQATLPWTKPASVNKADHSDGRDEAFNIQVPVDNVIETATTAAEAQKAMVELIESGLADQEHEFDPDDAIVDGFQDHIKLLPHQIIGRKWMREREEGKKFGGILADDMGLGKTIQTLTRIVEGRPSREDRDDWSRATLVVCPVSLIGQWGSEIKKMAVGLRVLEHTGASRTRDPGMLSRHDVVITSYQTLTSEHGNWIKDGNDESKSKSKSSSSKPSQDDSSESDTIFGRTLANKKTTTGGRAKKAPQNALFQVKWWRIVLDEGHNIKNHKAKSSIACCEIQAKYRWILTGTPLQNNVEELYAFFKFLRIRPLNDWPTFNETINKPVKSGKSARAMKRLQIVLQAVMLRRTKESTMNGKKLLELPARVVDMVECEFDDSEREFYKSLEDKTSKVFEDLARNGMVMKNLTSVLVMLLRLRQACDHPSLVSKDYRKDADALDATPSQKDGKDDADALADMFGGLSVAKAKCTICQTELEPDHKSPNCSDCALTLAIEARRKSVGRPGVALNTNLPPESAKIRKMLELLQRIDDESDGTDKTIIFSQFTTMMDLMEPFLKDAGIKFVRYDGSMNSDQRKAAIERITTSKSTKVILISFKAGGTGLNLTCCNRVILVDMWWNPALEDQAFDRAHRFGQKKDVMIYKLMVENTIEQRILQLQETKRALAAAALGGHKLGSNKLGLQDLMALFRPGAGQSDDEDD